METVKNIYHTKDGRVRAYCVDENGKPHTRSYPRILMAQKLGRPLEPDEDVHHIDGDFQNNSISNLEIIKHGQHQRMHSRKYEDKEMICDVCHKRFIWTAKRQANYYRDLNRHVKRIITCSKSCSSYAGRQEQLGRKF